MINGVIQLYFLYTLTGITLCVTRVRTQAPVTCQYPTTYRANPTKKKKKKQLLQLASPIPTQKPLQRADNLSYDLAADCVLLGDDGEDVIQILMM
jgi:hypothetical protein